LLRTIVLATDFSPACDAALELVADLAPHIEATVVLVHVVDDARFVPFFGGITLSTNEARDALGEATESLDSMATELRARGVPAFVRVLLGPIQEMIGAVCRGVRADLLVVGARHTGALHELFAGMSARELAMQIRVPVLLVPPDEPVEEETGEASP
jgi:nucleotide-binding universal stress UspA family protein